MLSQRKRWLHGLSPATVSWCSEHEEKGTNEQWKCALCTLFILAAIRPHIKQNKKDEGASSKSITSFDITFELSKTLGSSSSMILFNNWMDHRKTKGLSYKQMLSELDAIKIYRYPSQQDQPANPSQQDDVVRLKGWSAIRKCLLTLVQNITKCRYGYIMMWWSSYAKIMINIGRRDDDQKMPG